MATYNILQMTASRQAAELSKAEALYAAIEEEIAKNFEKMTFAQLSKFNESYPGVQILETSPDNAESVLSRQRKILGGAIPVDERLPKIPKK